MSVLVMSEAQLQTTLIDAARLLGYRVAHFRPANTAKGYRTPVEGHAGFVDLVIARPGSTVFAWELKSPTGHLSSEQVAWQEALGAGALPPPVVDARAISPAGLDTALSALLLGRWPSGERSAS